MRILKNFAESCLSRFRDTSPADVGETVGATGKNSMERCAGQFARAYFHAVPCLSGDTAANRADVPIVGQSFFVDFP